MISNEEGAQLAQFWIDEVEKARSKGRDMPFQQAYDMIKIRYNYAFFAIMYYPGMGELEDTEKLVNEDFEKFWKNKPDWPSKVKIVDSQEVGTLTVLIQRAGNFLFFENEVYSQKADESDFEKEQFKELGKLIYWYMRELPDVLQDVLNKELK